METGTRKEGMMALIMNTRSLESKIDEQIRINRLALATEEYVVQTIL